MEVVEYVNPANAPTVTFAVVRLVPVMVNEFGPATVFRHILPNAVSAVAVIDGVAVTNDCWLPQVVPPELVA